MNTIEQQLWDYIDGNLNEMQVKSIEEKINADAQIKLQYEELLRFNLTISKLELEEPSMSFTRNVMDDVALEPAPVSLKTKVNTNIIYGIAVFFILSLLALFSYVLYNTNLKFSGFDLKLNLDFNWDKYLTKTTIYSFLFGDLVIGLVFLDYLLRKRAAPKH